MKWVKKYEINTDLLSSKCASNDLMLNKILLKDNNLSDIKNLKKIIRYLMIFTVYLEKN